MLAKHLLQQTPSTEVMFFFPFVDNNSLWPASLMAAKTCLTRQLNFTPRELVDNTLVHQKNTLQETPFYTTQCLRCDYFTPENVSFFRHTCFAKPFLQRAKAYLDFRSDLAAIREPRQAPMLKITEVWTRGIEIPLKAESGSCCLARHRSTRIRQWSNFSLHCFSSQGPSFDLTHRPKLSHHSKSCFKTRIGKDMQRHLATSARFFNIPASKLIEVSPQAPIKLSRGEIAFRKGFAVIVEACEWD